MHWRRRWANVGNVWTRQSQFHPSARTEGTTDRLSPRRLSIRTGRRDWLWGIALGAVALAVTFFAFAALRPSSVKTYATTDGVDCQSGERLEYHVHAFVAILVDGERTEIPAGVGIRSECLFWLHTHTADGLIHVEAPQHSDFTLGQFFAIWGEPLSATQLLGTTVDQDHQIVTTVNGQPYEGDPSQIVLADHETIVLQYGPPFGEAPGSPFEQ